MIYSDVITAIGVLLVAALFTGLILCAWDN